MVGEWAKGEMKNEKSRVLRYSATVLQFEIGVFKVIRKFYIYIYIDIKNIFGIVWFEK